MTTSPATVLAPHPGPPTDAAAASAASPAPPSAAHPVDAPATSLRGSVAEQLALVVAPSTGRFQPGEGTTVTAGGVIGHVTGGRGRADAVHAPIAGEVAGVLVRAGQLVRGGQALVWLRREAA